MTNTLAVILGTLIVTALLADAIFTGGENSLFLAKKFTDMTEWIAFWR